MGIYLEGLSRVVAGEHAYHSVSEPDPEPGDDVDEFCLTAVTLLWGPDGEPLPGTDGLGSVRFPVEAHRVAVRDRDGLLQHYLTRSGWDVLCDTPGELHAAGYEMWAIEDPDTGEWYEAAGIIPRRGIRITADGWELVLDYLRGKQKTRRFIDEEIPFEKLNA